MTNTVTTAALLERLNVLREEQGQPSLRAFKGSKAQIQAMIDKLAPFQPVELSVWCRKHGKNPKIVRAKLRRHVPRPPGGKWMATPEVLTIIGQ